MLLYSENLRNCFWSSATEQTYQAVLPSSLCHISQVWNKTDQNQSPLAGTLGPRFQHRLIGSASQHLRTYLLPTWISKNREKLNCSAEKNVLEQRYIQEEPSFPSWPCRSCSLEHRLSKLYFYGLCNETGLISAWICVTSHFIQLHETCKWWSPFIFFKKKLCTWFYVQPCFLVYNSNVA